MNWKNWRGILMAILIVVAIFHFGIGSIILDTDFQQDLIQGISIQFLLGIVSVVGAGILWKLGGPDFWRYIALGVFALIAFFNLGISSALIDWNLETVLVGSFSMKLILGVLALYPGFYALWKKL